MASTRQLAAIVFTDIVGYTALMGSDEQKAFELLSKNRQIQKPIIEEFNGRFIKELGDGILASFNTVSDAVNAAVKIQETCNKTKDLSLRIGIHHGEVIFEQDDIFGDAVNIASRIQTLGAPGSILFSKKINDEIKNKSEFKAVSLGHFDFKNVKEPLEVFALANAGLIVPKRERMSGKLSEAKSNFSKRNTLIIIFLLIFLGPSIFIYKRYFSKENSAGEKSIAVLPFTSMSADKQNEYFSDGVSSEITSQLSKIASLDVRAWNSCLQFKNSTKSLKEKAEALNAAIILAGSIQKEGDDIRIQAELMNADNNKRIWGKTYDRKWGDIFSIQSEIAQEIAHELNAELTEGEKEKIERKPTDNLQAYEYYLQGNQLSEKMVQTLKQEFFDNSKLMFEKAIALDTNYALAHAGLAKLYANYFDFTISDSMWLLRAKKEIEKAYALAPDLDFVNATRGLVLQEEGQLEASYESFRKAIQINPNNAFTLLEFGMLFSDLGLVENRIKLLKKAIKLDPLNATYFGFLGGAEVHINRLDEGLQHLQTALRLEPNMFYIVDRIAYIYALKNQLKEAEFWLNKFLKLLPPERAEKFNEAMVPILLIVMPNWEIKPGPWKYRKKPEFIWL